jgi:hypothetical protein
MAIRATEAPQNRSSADSRACVASGPAYAIAPRLRCYARRDSIWADRTVYRIGSPTCLCTSARSVAMLAFPSWPSALVNSGQGCTGPLDPRSSRNDCRMANVVVLVKTSMSAAASTPVYLAMMGVAARSVTASRWAFTPAQTFSP